MKTSTDTSIGERKDVRDGNVHGPTRFQKRTHVVKRNRTSTYQNNDANPNQTPTAEQILSSQVYFTPPVPRPPPPLPLLGLRPTLPMELPSVRGLAFGPSPSSTSSSPDSSPHTDASPAGSPPSVSMSDVLPMKHRGDDRVSASTSALSSSSYFTPSTSGSVPATTSPSSSSSSSSLAPPKSTSSPASTPPVASPHLRLLTESPFLKRPEGVPSRGTPAAP